MKKWKRFLGCLLSVLMTAAAVPGIPVMAETGTELPFKDVSSGAWFYENVQYVYEQELMNGTAPDLFSPENSTNRAMLVTILYRSEGEPEAQPSTFKDVKAGMYYTDAVSWAAAEEIVNGIDPNTFGPEKNVTREQIAAILYRFADGKDCNIEGRADLSSFNDAASISAYARDAMAWANDAGLIKGRDGNMLAPGADAKRCEIAAILQRFFENPDIWDQDRILYRDIKDADEDGLSDLDEEEYKTDPAKPDTDEDGVTDYEEVVLGTDPLTADEFDETTDTDEDGLPDYEEATQYKTNPDEEDTDGDDVTDYDEIFILGTDPRNPDTDGDGLTDGFESLNELDPLAEKTDGETPDSEVPVFQVTDERNTSKELQDESNLAFPYLAGDAKGDLSRTAFLTAAKDAAFDANRAVVGKAVNIDASADSIKGMNLFFDLSNYKEIHSDLSTLSICRLTEDGIIELLESERDGSDLFVTLKENGVYFVMDIAAFLKNLDVNINDIDNGSDAEPLSAGKLMDDTIITGHPVSGQADIVFVVDTTGSMSDEINNVKTNITAFTNQLNEDYNVKVNYALIDYKDLEEDGPGTTVVVQNGSSNWYSDVDTFIARLNSLSIDGGGDAPECAVDALETARNLDYRPNASKFIILVTDAGYKILNRYEIESMDQEADLLTQSKIIASVVTSGSYQNDYRPVYEKTGGMYANIYSNFSDVLMQLSELIGEETSDGNWYILKHGYRYVKIPFDTDGDCDDDGLSDEKELGKAETVDVTAFVKFLLALNGVSFDKYMGKKEIEVYNAVSDPTMEDSENDGINDKDDDAPWVKGYKDGSIGELKMLAVKGDGACTVALDYVIIGGANTGHSFLIYDSYVKDSLDLSSWNGGYAANNGSWVDAIAQKSPPSDYKLTPSSYFAFSAGGNDDFSPACAIFNMEFQKHKNPPNYSYKPNQYYSEKVTQSQLEKILSVMDEEAGKEYKAVKHNCTHVTLNVWNAAYNKNINPLGINTPTNLYSWLEKRGGSSDFNLDSIIH